MVQSSGKGKSMNRRSMIKATLAFAAFSSLRVTAKPKRKCITVLQRCVGCSDCSRVCPTGAIAITKGKAIIDSETCVGCFLCSAACTYGAIERWEKKQ